MKTLILGLGNLILGDDAVGVRVASAVAEWLAETFNSATGLSTGWSVFQYAGEEINVAEAAVGGLQLMELMVGHDRAILIDAITTAEGQPGAVYRLTAEDLCSLNPTHHSASAHDTNLATALALGQRMQLSLPQEIVIYAIEAENVGDFGTELTPAVAAAIPAVVAAVASELREPAHS